MSMSLFLQAACQQPLTRTNEFIGYKEAYYRVNTVFNQYKVGAYQFDLEKLRTFIEKIDNYNQSNQLSDDEKITSIRGWKAVSSFDQDFPCVDDLVLVPVRNDGDDAHAYSESIVIDPLRPTLGNLEMLSSARPCPNMCGTHKYFHIEDALPTGNFPPNPINNPYRNCKLVGILDDEELTGEERMFIF